MTPSKTRADRVAPLAAAFAASDLLRLSITDGQFSLEMVRRSVPPLPLAQPHRESALPQPTSAIEQALPDKAAPAVLRAELVGIVRLSNPRLAVGFTAEPELELFAIEALGVRTPVTSPVKARVLELLVADGSPVEYGQALVVIEDV